MGEEHCNEDLDQEGYSSLGKMLQGPVRDTVRALALLTLRPLMASWTSSGLRNWVRWQGSGR